VSQICGQADALIAEWQAHRGLVDLAVLALVRELRQTVPIVLVSNATDWLERDLATLGLVSEVDTVVNSSRLGVAKPEAAIYRHAAALAGTTADRCVFVDDQPENVEGARMVGMRAILYAGLDAMRRELASMGYLRPARDRE
jgi:putative hydrolase of the HAD superfamily